MDHAGDGGGGREWGEWGVRECERAVDFHSGSGEGEASRKRRGKREGAVERYAVVRAWKVDHGRTSGDTKTARSDSVV